MSKDYIPRSDEELIAWLENFAAQTTKDKAKLKIPDSTLAKMDGLTDDFKAAVNAVNAAQVILNAAVQDKNIKRKLVVAEARSRSQQIHVTDGVTDADRARYGLSLRDLEPTPAPTPDSRPVVTIDTGERLRHRLDYRDGKTLNLKARPEGVIGCEIWRFIGATQPTGPSQYQLITMDVVTPYIVEFDEADAGKTAYYMLRWINARGEKGPWSETVSATITG